MIDNPRHRKAVEGFLEVGRRLLQQKASMTPELWQELLQEVCRLDLVPFTPQEAQLLMSMAERENELSHDELLSMCAAIVVGTVGTSGKIM